MPRLTEATRKRIIAMHDAGETYDAIVEATKVSRATIAKLVKGKTPTLGKTKLSTRRLAELKRTIKALPDDQLDEVAAGIVGELVKLVADIVGPSDAAGALVAAARGRGKVGKALATAVEKSAKAAPTREPLEPAVVIERQLMAVNDAMEAARRVGDTRAMATYARIVPGLNRTYLKYMPPAPPDTDDDPDWILAAAGAREKLHALVDRVLEEREERDDTGEQT